MSEKKENRKENHTYKTSKWIAVMTAVCMTAMLAGCGNTDTVETRTETAVTAEASAEEGTAEPETVQRRKGDREHER